MVCPFPDRLVTGPSFCQRLSAAFVRRPICLELPIYFGAYRESPSPFLYRRGQRHGQPELPGTGNREWPSSRILGSIKSERRIRKAGRKQQIAWPVSPSTYRNLDLEARI